MTNTPTITNKEIPCPFCNQGRIEITITSEYYSQRASRISSKSKMLPVYHEERIEINARCPSCNRSKQEIKEAISRGTENTTSHEKRIERMKRSGLPTKIEF